MAAAIRVAGVVLSHPAGEHYPIEEIARQDLHQTQVREIAIKSGGGATASLLDGMGGKFKGHSRRIADALLHPLGEGYVDPVARNQITAALGNADDGPAGLQLFTSEAVVAVALQVHGYFALLTRPLNHRLLRRPRFTLSFSSIIYSQGFCDHVFERLPISEAAILLQEELHRLVQPLRSMVCTVGRQQYVFQLIHWISGR